VGDFRRPATREETQMSTPENHESRPFDLYTLAAAVIAICVTGAIILLIPA